MKALTIVLTLTSLFVGFWTFSFWYRWRKKDYYSKGLLTCYTPKILENIRIVDLLRSIIPIALITVLSLKGSDGAIGLLTIIIVLVRITLWSIYYFRTRMMREEGYSLADWKTVTFWWIALQVLFILPEVWLLIITLRSLL